MSGNLAGKIFDRLLDSSKLDTGTVEVFNVNWDGGTGGGLYEAPENPHIDDMDFKIENPTVVMTEDEFVDGLWVDIEDDILSDAGLFGEMSRDDFEDYISDSGTWEVFMALYERKLTRRQPINGVQDEITGDVQKQYSRYSRGEWIYEPKPENIEVIVSDLDHRIEMADTSDLWEHIVENAEEPRD